MVRTISKMNHFVVAEMTAPQ